MEYDRIFSDFENKKQTEGLPGKVPEKPSELSYNPE